MSETFFITPIPPDKISIAQHDGTNQGFQLDLSQFTKDFIARWGNSVTALREKDVFSIYCDEGDHQGFQVKVLNIEHQSIISFKPFFPEFVVWFREKVPAIYKLYLSSTSTSRYIEITRDTTAHQIETFI
jgi:hypothetical protein